MDKKFILNFIELNEISYKNSSDATSVLKSKNFSNIIFKDLDKDLQCFYATLNNDIYIVFRGTSSISDVINDVNFIPKKFLGCYAHRGYVNSYACCNDSLLSYVSNNVNPNSRIYISGHSLGGALSLLASAVLSEKFPMIDIVLVTFGCPKVFLKLPNAEKLVKDVLSYRFVNGDDVVPNLPKSIFTHVSDAIFLKKPDNNDKILEHRLNSYKTTAMALVC